MKPYIAYKLLQLMVDDLNDMCNNYDISEFETDSFKQSVLAEIDMCNITNKMTFTLIKKGNRYRLIY